MGGADVSVESQFQQTVTSQIASYEADLAELRRDGAAPEEISTFELIVGDLRRLQLEDLADLARLPHSSSDGDPASRAR